MLFRCTVAVIGLIGAVALCQAADQLASALLNFMGDLIYWVTFAPLVLAVLTHCMAETLTDAANTAPARYGEVFLGLVSFLLAMTPALGMNQAVQNIDQAVWSVAIFLGGLAEAARATAGLREVFAQQQGQFAGAGVLAA
jgi:hypothetical protein